MVVIVTHGEYYYRDNALRTLLELVDRNYPDGLAALKRITPQYGVPFSNLNVRAFGSSVTRDN